MMEITHVNQSCPHCQALVILPELVRNYGDMPIQCQPALGGFYQAGAVLFWPVALGFSLARLGFNWSQPLW
jgi:hypothetical protein